MTPIDANSIDSRAEPRGERGGDAQGRLLPRVAKKRKDSLSVAYRNWYKKLSAKKSCVQTSTTVESLMCSRKPRYGQQRHRAVSRVLAGAPLGGHGRTGPSQWRWTARSGRRLRPRRRTASSYARLKNAGLATRLRARNRRLDLCPQLDEMLLQHPRCKRRCKILPCSLADMHVGHWCSMSFRRASSWSSSGPTGRLPVSGRLPAGQNTRGRSFAWFAIASAAGSPEQRHHQHDQRMSITLARSTSEQPERSSRCSTGWPDS